MPLKKVLICPFFGPFPPWMNKFEWPKGYHMIIDTDLSDFKLRVKQKLGIDYPGIYGSGKVWDMRCALGLLYEDEIKGYDWWGHCDLDVVFGDVDKFVPDSMLNELDVYSGHNEYVAGCFSLYRNCPEVNELFKKDILPDEMQSHWEPLWKTKMSDPQPNGWVEVEFSRTLEQSSLRYKYDWQQGNPWTRIPILKKEGVKLFQDMNVNATRSNPDYVWQEVCFYHFRHSKIWPL